MAIPEDKKLELIKFEIEKIPLNADGTALVDFYVHLPRNDRYIRFVLAGDSFGENQTRMLQKHKEPIIFCKYEEFVAEHSGFAIPPSEHNKEVLEIFQGSGQISENLPHLIFEANPTPTSDQEAGSTNNQPPHLKIIRGDDADLHTHKNQKMVFKGSNDLASREKGKFLTDETSSRQSHGPSEDEPSSRHTRLYQEEDYSGSKQSLSTANTNDGESMENMIAQFGQEKSSYLKKTITNELKSAYKQLHSESPATINLEESPIQDIASNLLEVIAPEVEKLRDHLKKIPDYVGVMNDSAALTAITTLVCLARGQTSRSIFKEMSYAVLLMDMSMTSLDDEAYKNYFINPDALSEKQKKIVFTHPRASYELVQKKFKNLPDIVSQLILGHHELFNGKGYPRKVRSELLAPLVRILAFAVDIFELMKRNHYLGKKLSIVDAVDSLLNADVPPHLRRHNVVLMREVYQYLTVDPE